MVRRGVGELAAEFPKATLTEDAAGLAPFAWAVRAHLAGERRLEYHILEERCCAEQVKAYPEGLAQQAQHLGKEMIVVLDNAGFH